MNCIALSDRKFSEWWSGKDVKTSCHATVWGICVEVLRKAIKSQLWKPVCGFTFEPGTSEIRSRSANNSSWTFGYYFLEENVQWPLNAFVNNSLVSYNSNSTHFPVFCVCLGAFAKRITHEAPSDNIISFRTKLINWFIYKCVCSSCKLALMFYSYKAMPSWLICLIKYYNYQIYLKPYNRKQVDSQPVI